MQTDASSPFVSIVTPNYNDGPYLEECIKSVLGQTHPNFEYIICDNHSTDGSATIARDYAARDSRIRVVSPPEFYPQVKNFNFALSNISPESKYCKMVLSDDWLFPECVRQMVAVAEAHGEVALVGSYRVIETRPAGFGLPVRTTVLPGKEAGRIHLLDKARLFGNQSGVLYRSDIVRQRAPNFFVDNRLNFDLDVALQILLSHDFGFVHQVLVFQRDQPGAITDEIRAMNYWYLSCYLALEEYGPHFLETEELHRELDEARRKYYSPLGRVWLADLVKRRRQDEFWSFQRKNLATIGDSLRPALLARSVGESLLTFARDPAQLWYAMRRAR
jgi:glycosyltransferase involved in cell wall biosynthesis